MQYCATDVWIAWDTAMVDQLDKKLWSEQSVFCD